MRIGHIRALGYVGAGFDIQVRFDTLVTDSTSKVKQLHTGAMDLRDPPTSQNESDLRTALKALLNEVSGKKGNAKAPPMIAGYRDRLPDSIIQIITKMAKEFGLEVSND